MSVVSIGLPHFMESTYTFSVEIVCFKDNFAVFRPITIRVIVKMPHMHPCLRLVRLKTHWTPKFVNWDFQLREASVMWPSDK